MYAPSVAGAIVGPSFAEEVKDHPMMQAANVPAEARGCHGALTGAIGAAVANGIGYVIGRYVIGSMS